MEPKFLAPGGVDRRHKGLWYSARAFISPGSNGKGKLANVAQCIPALHSLGLSESDVPWWEGIQLEDMLPQLALFTNVTTLALPIPQAIDPGFNPPECGTTYFTYPGLREQVAKEEKESIARLAKLVKENLPIVQKLRLGEGEWQDLRGNQEQSWTVYSGFSIWRLLQGG